MDDGRRITSQLLSKQEKKKVTFSKPQCGASGAAPQKARQVAAFRGKKYIYFTSLCLCFSPFSSGLKPRRPVGLTEEDDVYILDNGKTAEHLIEKKIKEFDSMVTKCQDLSFDFQ